MIHDDIVDPSLFSDSKKVMGHYTMYVNHVLRPKWIDGASKLTSLVDLRDFVEDITGVPVKEDFLRELKLKLGVDRQMKAIDYLCARALDKLPEMTSKWPDVPKDILVFAIEQELKVYFEKAAEVCRYRPVLGVPRSTVESVLAKMDSEQQTIKTFEAHKTTLGLSNAWPVYALWVASRRGEAEDLFVHPPMPRVFGSPSCVRNDIERSSNASKLVLGVTKNLQFENCVLAGLGRLAWRHNGTWSTSFVPEACLVAGLPGLVGHVWLLNPETMACAIYKREEKMKLIFQFDLPFEADVKVNWIDCQRDPEGALVLLWGHINALTGSLLSQNACAFDEDALVSDKIEFLDSFEPLHERRKVGRIDWRDHGNLLSVHHVVTESDTDERKWVHTHDIVFGNHLLMTLTTETRPIEAIFGCPTEMMLLSPLSSKSLQHWTIQNGSAQMLSALEVPLMPSGRWQSLAVN